MKELVIVKIQKHYLIKLTKGDREGHTESRTRLLVRNVCVYEFIKHFDRGYGPLQ